MTDTSEDHESTVRIRGRTITILHFADDMDGLAGEEEEQAKLVERLDKAFHSLRHEDQCQENQADDKQHKWHKHIDQSEWTDA